MSAGESAPPPGYERVRLGGTELVAIAPLLEVLHSALADGTLYDHAARHPQRRGLHGRAPTWAIPLPGTAEGVVVRHSWHGGALARLTRDWWLAPTRAPLELATALRLRAWGVPTPEVVAYATYRVAPALRRADVMTRLVADGADLGALLAGDATGPALPHGWLAPVARLLARLAGAGARHADLNVKNILLAPDATGATTAFVLDVDRVTFGPPRDSAIFRANLARLERSARKWRRERGARVSDDDLAELARMAAEPTA